VTDPDLLVRNISDTAMWAAAYRAAETERPDALFRDPFARRLAGARGQKIAQKLTFKDSWAWVTRTYVFDRYLTAQIEAGADMVVNLAAGLDARPFRMALPARLVWVEIDLPDLLAHKEESLRNEKPACVLERIPLDLADRSARQEVFARLGRRAKRAVVVTEGLMIYLTAEEAGALADDLAAIPGFRTWALDLVSPGLLRMLRKKMSADLDRAGAPLKFGPPEGPPFFIPHGWRPVEVASLARTADRLGRLSVLMRLLAKLPESTGAQGSRPWGGVCLLENGGAG
jgi:methyltransferase (TIGR00027 family)